MCLLSKTPMFLFYLECFLTINPRIIVLTFNRPRSLARLLRSLEAAHYDFPQNNPGWEIRLEIRIDGGGGEEGDLVRNVARNFRFSHGSKRIVISDTNMGIMAAWREAWSWRDREMFIVIEDDVEMSVFWYRALVNMWLAYGDRWAAIRYHIVSLS